MNVGSYYCIGTNTDKSGKIISCTLRSKDGLETIERSRESIIKDLRGKRIGFINLDYSNGKLRKVAISNTETGKKALYSVQSSLQTIAGNLVKKSMGSIKYKALGCNWGIEDGLIACAGLSFKNINNGKTYDVIIAVGVNGDYFVRDSIEGDYNESFNQKVVMERLVYKMAQSVLL